MKLTDLPTTIEFEPRLNGEFDSFGRKHIVELTSVQLASTGWLTDEDQSLGLRSVYGVVLGNQSQESRVPANFTIAGLVTIFLLNEGVQLATGETLDTYLRSKLVFTDEFAAMPEVYVPAVNNVLKAQGAQITRVPSPMSLFQTRPLLFPIDFDTTNKSKEPGVLDITQSITIPEEVGPRIAKMFMNAFTTQATRIF